MNVDKWANGLTVEQMRKLLVELVQLACEAEHVQLGDLAPYWEDTGEPLIEGQEVFSND